MSFRQTDFPEGAAYFGSNRGWCYTETTAGAVGSRTWKTIQFNVDFRHKLTQIWCKCLPKSNISFEIHSQCIFFKCSEIFLELFADFLFIQQDLLKVLCEPTVCFLYKLWWFWLKFGRFWLTFRWKSSILRWFLSFWRTRSCLVLGLTILWEGQGAAHA